LPSPALVGVIAVTQIRLPPRVPRRRSSADSSILALKRPYGWTSSGSSPRPCATSTIGRRRASRATAMLEPMTEGSELTRWETLSRGPTAGAPTRQTPRCLLDVAEVREHRSGGLEQDLGVEPEREVFDVEVVPFG